MAIALQKHQPDLTDDAVKELHTTMFAQGHKEGMATLAKLFAIAFDAEDVLEAERAKSPKQEG